MPSVLGKISNPSRKVRVVTPPAVRVLIVDDNRDVADSLALLLTLFRYESRVAYDGREGLRVAREWAPDCLISDIRMPGLDGYALAREVRADPTLAEIRLVAHSAFAGEPHARLAAEAGFDHRITKGADERELLEVLKMVEQIKELARQNVELAGQAKELLQEVRDDIKEVKQEVKELKQEVKELKDQQETE